MAWIFFYSVRATDVTMSLVPVCRMELQAHKDSVSKELDDMKSEAATFMSEMTNMVQDGKRKHTELSHEVRLLDDYIGSKV